ncbi:alpha/beta hydrolase [Actinoplanes sp. NPDC051851]|uniref:alpha/beta hydrolase n=1 Tax=Actinoplanes sp. NPDC051851 TaxID=3154753 RepID=UPI00343B7316
MTAAPLSFSGRVTLSFSGRVTYARLRATDPARWTAAALDWRRWAALAGVLGADLGSLVTRLRAAWSGAAADAATAVIDGFRRRITLFRLVCWRVDQALSEFAAALGRARSLLDRARAAGLVIHDDGTVSAPPPATAPAGSAAPAAASVGAIIGSAGVATGSAAPVAGSADLAAALSIAAEADTATVERLAGISVEAVPPRARDRPSCAATAAEVRAWWGGLGAAERMWLLAVEPGSVAGFAGVPVADRDLANRLLLDTLPNRAGLDALRARIDGASGSAPAGKSGSGDGGYGSAWSSGGGDGGSGDGGSGLRAYLIGLNVAADGRAVIALGDPDLADNVLTHVPGMTADLESVGGELTRAERVAERATDVRPAEATSAILWLDYDAPDFLDEAWSARQAEEGAAGLRSFQEGLRTTHEGAGRLTVLGHSYGSLLVGRAAAGGLAAENVVFVGSPGVGADSVGELHLPAGQRVWASTSVSDPIQYLAIDPVDRHPGRDLWFGRDPSDPGFGARVFHSQVDAGHLGYWDPGRPALDALAAITLGDRPGP